MLASEYQTRLKVVAQDKRSSFFIDASATEEKKVLYRRPQEGGSAAETLHSIAGGLQVGLVSPL